MRKQLALLGLIVLGMTAAYLPSIDGQFVFDDTSLVGDPRVVDPFGQATSAWLNWERPIAAFTFALNHLAVGLDPRGWHLTNVAIHAGVVVLVWLFTRIVLTRAGFSRPAGPTLAVAGLFALHPLQTESVSYITQRYESLASGFYVGALLLLLARDEGTSRWRRHGLLAGAVGLELMGLLVKPILATLPVAWLLHATVLPPAGEAGVPAWRRVWRRVPAALPLFAVSIVSGIQIVGGISGSVSAGFALPGLTPGRYLATELRVIPTYLRLLLWPAGQCADWYFRVSTSWLEPGVIGGAALLVALTATAVFGAVRVRAATGDGPAAARVASLGALFFLLVLAPSSSVIPLLDPLAERRVYLASVGVFIAASAAVALLLRRIAGSRAAAVGAALVLVALAVCAFATVRRNEVWANAVALWSDAAEKSPRKARAHLNLGAALLEANRPAEALASLHRVRDLGCEVDGQKLLVSIVHVLVSLGRMGEARAEVDRVLAGSPRNPLALAELAVVELGSGREIHAERAALAAIAVDPRHPVALEVLGLVRLRRGDVPGSLEPLRAAAATHVVDPMVYASLGEAEERSGAIAAACAAYLRAAGLPGNGWVSETARAQRKRLGCP